ncbi:MAG: hypothetical protein IPM16_21590 [Chloroflexi bacterium]|nr:hypothetical protein [Chloroflexota bacterium]
MVQSPWVAIAKYIVVGLIWIGVLTFAVVTASTSALSSSNLEPLAAIGIAAFITAAISTGVILVPGAFSKSDGDTAARTSEKPKNDRSADPMSLLTPDDLDELRAEMKQRLRERMLSAGEGELTPLDSLLAEQEHKARR